MNRFIQQTLILFLASAFAVAASAQSPTNTATQTRTSPPQNATIQTQLPATGTQLNGTARAPTAANQRQTVRTNRIQSNPNVTTQPGVSTTTVPQAQQAPVTAQPQFRRNVDPRAVQTTPPVVPPGGVLQSQALVQPTFRRAPDIGLWFNRPSANGLVIADIAPTAAIANLGFREGDRILTVNGRPVVTEPEFMQSLITGDPNPVQVVVFRDGRNQVVTVDPSLFTQQVAFAPTNPLDQFGIVLDDRFDDRIVVWRVIPESPAFYAGFRPGDVVTTLGGQPFRTRTAFETALAGMRTGQANIQIRRGDRVRDLVIDVPRFYPMGRQADVRSQQPAPTSVPRSSDTLEQERSPAANPRVERR